MFMETLLTPTPNTIDKVFDGERAAEIFAHTEIQISVRVMSGTSYYYTTLFMCIIDSVM